MNKYLTLSELVQKVIVSLSMYAGTATQKYAEDRIAEMILQTFNTIYDDRFWSELCHWYKYTLTGVDGVCAEDVSKDFSNFNDICCITHENNKNYKLKRLNNSTNPYLITGDTPGYYIHAKDNTGNISEPKQLVLVALNSEFLHDYGLEATKKLDKYSISK